MNKGWTAKPGTLDDTIGSTIGMTDISSRLNGGTSGMNRARDMIRNDDNTPTSKLGPKEGATSKGTGVGKNNR